MHSPPDLQRNRIYFFGRPIPPILLAILGFLAFVCCIFVAIGNTTSCRPVVQPDGASPSSTISITSTATSEVLSQPVPTITSSATTTIISTRTSTPTQTPRASERTSTPTRVSSPPPSSACPQGCVTPPANCLIKGNISSSGEKIYHVPGGAFYNQTIIDPSKGERWFCTEQEAIANGWRKSLR